MSKNSRTYIPATSLTMMLRQTADDFVFAREGNILIGQEIAPSISHSSAKHNIVVGHKAGANLTDGDYNTFIGYGVGVSNESNKLRIGNRQLAGTDLVVGTFGENIASQDVTLNGDVIISATTQSTNKDTGCLILEGGLGVEKNTNIGGNTDIIGTLTVNDTTDATSSITGSTIIDGGLGVAKKVYVGSSTDTTAYNNGALVVTGGVGVAKDLNAKDLFQTRTGSDGLDVPYLLIPAGTIMPYAVASAPSGYLLCNGSAVLRTAYSVLFGILSTTYGSGNGTTTFNIPNLQGKTIVGRDSSDGSFNEMGETGGSKDHTLTTAQLPSHNHIISNGTTVYLVSNTGTQTVGNPDSTAGEIDNNTFTTQTSTSGGITSHDGSTDSFSIMNPYVVLSYIIKY